MIFKSEGKLTEEIAKLSAELEELRANDAKNFLGADSALHTTVKNISAAYAARDWLRMKNGAAYIMETNIVSAPQEPSAERDWAEISSPEFGVRFPSNWGLPADTVMPRGKFTVFGATQKTGKSRAMISHCLFLADRGHQVSIMSAEMPSSQIWLLAWMQKQYLDHRNSFGEIEARLIMASKDVRHKETRDSYHDFRERYGKKWFVLYTPGWTARRIVYGHKLAENLFGKPAAIWATDYAQLIAKEAQIKDMREGQIHNSQFFTISTGLANTAHILVSQLNDAGDTAESKQYERDAGMVINFYRDANKETGEKSPSIKIHIKHSRSTASGIYERWLDVKSGAIVPNAGYTPPESQMRIE